MMFMTMVDEEWATYKQWSGKACMDMSKPCMIGRPRKVTDVTDENLPKAQRVQLDFEFARYSLYRNCACFGVESTIKTVAGS